MEEYKVKKISKVKYNDYKKESLDVYHFESLELANQKYQDLILETENKTALLYEYKKKVGIMLIDSNDQVLKQYNRKIGE